MTETSPTSGPAHAGPVILRADRLVKSFPGLVALDAVSLEVSAGEIVALLGQNGSGKSTLVKILAGVYQAESGSISVTDTSGAPRDPKEALHFIHQDLGLIDSLSAVENLALDEIGGVRALGPLRRRAERRRAAELISRFGMDIDVTRPVGELSPAQRTLVAIARAMSGWTRHDNVLILDEPTASLHGEEVAMLFAAIRRVAEAGAGVVFISHRLEEVTELADRVVVLRDGRPVADRSAAGLDAAALAELITGKTAATGSVARTPHGGHREAVLSLRGLKGRTLAHLDLDLAPGEIVGVAGSIGSGREHLAGLVYGSEPRDGGEVLVEGLPLRPDSPRAALRRGLALVPADRHAHGGVMAHSVRENLVLPDLRSFTRGRVHLDRSRQVEETRLWSERVDIQPRMPERALGLFSGGNQQKAVIARWLRTRPKVLLVEEPTQGVDIGASEAVRRLLVDAAAEGMAILVTSSDNTDLIRTCHRVLVLRDGVVAAELEGDDINEHRLTQECLGMAAADLAHVVEEATTSEEATHV